MQQILCAIALFSLLIADPRWCGAQTISAPSEESAMRRHYDAAYRLQSKGRLEDADQEHMAFLVDALTHSANGYANVGDYARAQPIYDEALVLAPNGLDLVKNYAGAALDANDFEKAKMLLSMVLRDGDKNLPALEASTLWRKLGDADLSLGHGEASAHDYQTALDLNRSCENLFALAHAELVVQGKAAVPAAFSQFFSQCGDSAGNHFKVGRAYALNSLPQEAAEEFERALRKNPALTGLHFSLGAAYLSQAKQFDRAEAEFRKELALNPNDKYSYPQLGHIALVRHNSRGAETDYRRAIAADPDEASNYIQLGQILSDEDRHSEGEPLLRRAIALTSDPSKENYIVERAHFMLGRILMKDGKRDEAEHEFSVSKDLLDRSRQHDIDLLSADTIPVLPLSSTRTSTEADRVANEQFEERIAPLIAGSYNNLGVHAAMANDFVKATQNFELAAKWNPKLAGVDINWGRAAFFAHMWAAAIRPLERALAAEPEDGELQSMLATCQKKIGNGANQ